MSDDPTARVIKQRGTYGQAHRAAAVFRRWQQEFGTTPTMREVADDMGLSACSTVQSHCWHAVKLGLLRRVEGHGRGKGGFRLPLPPPNHCAVCGHHLEDAS